jgi:hypothetical protein
MNETSGEETVPALYEHCVRAYKAMLAESKVVLDGSNVSEESGFAGQMVVYEGFMTRLIVDQLSLSVPYYTSVRQALINMGCIKQLRRGGGTSPSQWEMIKDPTVEAFMKQRPDKKPKQTRDSMLQDQILAVANRVNELEDIVNDLVQAWAKEFGTKEVKE